MHYTPISPPGAARARLRLETPAPLAERRRQRLERLVARFKRDDIEATVDGLIALLDQLDGDSDEEDDERSAAIMGEVARDRDYADDPLPTPDGLAGDPVDAEDEGHTELSGDELGDQGWTEWHGRSGIGKRLGREVAGAANAPDDAEDDDPAEDSDPDQCLAHDDGLAPIIMPYGRQVGASADDADNEAWVQPATLERPIPANDTVPA